LFSKSSDIILYILYIYQATYYRRRACFSVPQRYALWQHVHHAQLVWNDQHRGVCLAGECLNILRCKVRHVTRMLSDIQQVFLPKVWKRVSLSKIFSEKKYAQLLQICEQHTSCTLHC